MKLQRCEACDDIAATKYSMLGVSCSQGRHHVLFLYTGRQPLVSACASRYQTALRGRAALVWLPDENRVLEPPADRYTSRSDPSVSCVRRLCYRALDLFRAESTRIECTCMIVQNDSVRDDKLLAEKTDLGVSRVVVQSTRVDCLL